MYSQGCGGSSPFFGTNLTVKHSRYQVSLGGNKAYTRQVPGASGRNLVFSRGIPGPMVGRSGFMCLCASGHDERSARTRLWDLLLFDRETKTGSDPDLTFNNQGCVMLVSDPLCKSKSKS
jgi:hypothetical protein